MNVGDRIPEILGIDQDGREIKASDYRGRKIVLYSYPKANTSGCTAEACSLQAHKEELAAAGYEIIGVSKDKQALQKNLQMLKDCSSLLLPIRRLHYCKNLDVGARRWLVAEELLEFCALHTL